MTAAAGDRVRCTLPSDPKYLPLVRAVVQEGARLAGFDEELTHRILLATTEAVANVIRHVYRNATGERIDLDLVAKPDRLELEIIDYGRFVDPRTIASRPLDDVRPGGLGVHLMKSTMDVVEYRKNEHGGTTLTLAKNAHTQKEPS